MNIVTFDSIAPPPFTSEVEYLLGGLPRILYEDGTKQFVSMTTPPKHYSPRLDKHLLEEFCKEHIEKYREFRNKNEYLIISGSELPEIEKFW